MVLQTVGPVPLAGLGSALPSGLAGLVVVRSASATLDSSITDADLRGLPPTTTVVRDDGALLVLRGPSAADDVLVWLEQHQSSLQNVDVTLDADGGLAGHVLQLLLRCGWHTIGARLRARIGDRPVHRVRVTQEWRLDHEVEVTYDAVGRPHSDAVGRVLAQHRRDTAVTIGV
jgi:hypothetical protein